MKKAMIFAAGLGTRLKPFTDNHPKALAQVNGKTLLERNVRFLYQAGIREIVVNTHHFADQVEAAVGLINIPELPINISHEVEGPLETGGGLVFAKDFFLSDSDPFVVMNVDILSDINLKKMLHYHNENKPIASLAVTQRDSSRKFLFDEHKKLSGWQNTKTGEKRLCSSKSDNLKPFAFSGIHIVSPAIFQYMPQSGKFSITDIYLKIAEEHVIMGYDHSGDVVIDVGKPEAVAAAAELFN